jgi:hypothetical protein
VVYYFDETKFGVGVVVVVFVVVVVTGAYK